VTRYLSHRSEKRYSRGKNSYTISSGDLTLAHGRRLRLIEDSVTLMQSGRTHENADHKINIPGLQEVPKCWREGEMALLIPYGLAVYCVYMYTSFLGVLGGWMRMCLRSSVE
jgi:hypothetical protein